MIQGFLLESCIAITIFLSRSFSTFKIHVYKYFSEAKTVTHFKIPVISQSFGRVPIKMGGFPGGSDGKASACNAGDPGLIPGSGRSPGEGNGNPLQYSCLEHSMDGGAWWATVHGIAESHMTEQLHFTSIKMRRNKREGEKEEGKGG